MIHLQSRFQDSIHLRQPSSHETYVGVRGDEYGDNGIVGLKDSHSAMHLTAPEKDALVAAAELMRGMGAKKVFVFGSATTGGMRPGSDVDMAVSGLPARVYFSAVSRASDLIGRPVDLVDLDDDTPLVRHLLNSGDLIRVG